MLVSLKKIIGFPVFTQSGKKLGKVLDVNIEVDGHVVREYSVRASIFGSRVFLIRPIQVLEITGKKMVVEDAILKEKQLEQKIVSIPALEV